MLRRLLITPSHLAIPLAVQKWSIYRWGTNLSPTTVFYLYIMGVNQYFYIMLYSRAR